MFCIWVHGNSMPIKIYIVIYILFLLSCYKEHTIKIHLISVVTFSCIFARTCNSEKNKITYNVFTTFVKLLNCLRIRFSVVCWISYFVDGLTWITIENMIQKCLTNCKLKHISQICHTVWNGSQMFRLIFINATIQFNNYAYSWVLVYGSFHTNYSDKISQF